MEVHEFTEQERESLIDKAFEGLNIERKGEIVLAYSKY